MLIVKIISSSLLALLLSCGPHQQLTSGSKDVGTHSDHEAWLHAKEAVFDVTTFEEKLSQKVAIIFDSERFFTATATLIDKKGHFLTNYHVLSHCMESLKRDRERWHENWFSRLPFPKRSAQLHQKQKCPRLYLLDTKNWNKQIAGCFNAIEYLSSLLSQSSQDSCPEKIERILEKFDWQKSCPEKLKRLPSWIRKCQTPSKHRLSFWARQAAFIALDENAVDYFNIFVVSNYDINYSLDKTDDELASDSSLPPNERQDKLTGFEAVVGQAEGFNPSTFFSMYRASNIEPETFFEKKVFSIGFPIEKNYSRELLEERSKAQSLKVEDFSPLSLNITTGVINAVTETYNLNSTTKNKDRSKPYQGLDGSQGFSGAAVITNEKDPRLVGIMALTLFNDPDKKSDLDFVPGSIIVPSYRILNHYFIDIDTDKDAEDLSDNLVTKEKLPERLIGSDIQLPSQTDNQDTLKSLFKNL